MPDVVLLVQGGEEQAVTAHGVEADKMEMDLDALLVLQASPAPLCMACCASVLRRLKQQGGVFHQVMLVVLVAALAKNAF